MPYHLPHIFRSFWVKGAAVLLALSILFAIVVWCVTPDPLEEVLVWPVSPVLLDKDGAVVNARLSAQGEWCLPIPLEEMGTWLPKVLVAVEDKRFYSHSGVDLLALARAVQQNVTSGRVVSGASTISSQLVRLSNARPRTLQTKILEFVGAWKLERSLSKDEILEYYLNRAPFGGPIRGVEAASLMYFGKRSKDLSLGEASLLVGLLKGPTAYRPDRNPRAALARRQMIIQQIADQTGFPPDLTSLALQEPLPIFSPQMPARVWHFSDLAFKTLPSTGGVIRSTLDMRVQRSLEQALRDQLREMAGDVTAAGIVVDNRTATIVAYVGNARFSRENSKEWVDCAIAPRSPGSTLKPFVYLQAMEEGYITPATLLADTPLRLGGEAPRNFDRQYSGPVSAHNALAFSRNVPAVRVMRMVGVYTALTRLREAGFSYLNREESVYGDSLVLGAGEVTLLELARTYTAVASLGVDRPLLLRQLAVQDEDKQTSVQGTQKKQKLVGLEQYGKSIFLSKPRAAEFVRQHTDATEYFLTDSVLPSGLATPVQQHRAGLAGEAPAKRQMWSDAAAFLVTTILQDPGRLPFIAQMVQARENSPIAFKTGTSYGLRDAWTAAYTPAYTVVVWAGKASGGSDSHLVGLRMTAPAALTVSRYLLRTTPSRYTQYEAPASVDEAVVCTLSGAAPSSWCPALRKTRTISAVWRTIPCALHVHRNGKTVVVWPPELADFELKRYAAKDVSRPALITSPMRDGRYLLTPGVRSQPIALKAEGVAYPVHWYVNGSYIGEQAREDIPLYWEPEEGMHLFSLIDADERVTTREAAVTDLSAKVEEERAPLLR